MTTEPSTTTRQRKESDRNQETDRSSILLPIPTFDIPNI